jgi:hypothetical protein
MHAEHRLTRKCAIVWLLALGFGGFDDAYAFRPRSMAAYGDRRDLRCD